MNAAPAVGAIESNKLTSTRPDELTPAPTAPSLVPRTWVGRISQGGPDRMSSFQAKKMRYLQSYLPDPAPKPPRNPDPLKWFTEETGLFSAEPWTVKNVLPRLLSIGILVILSLLGIEFLRFLFRSGLKMLGGRR